MKIKTIPVLVFVSFIFLIFRHWFLAKEIIGGDWPYFYHENLVDFSLFPPAWSLGHGNGMGGIITAYFLDQYLYLTAFIFTNFLKLPWVIVYKISWFGMFLFLSVFSSCYLAKTILPKAELWQKLLVALIFTTNTYILMIVGGGQMGIAMAYSLAPLVLARFIKISNFRLSVSAGLVLAVQFMFDPRIAYLTMIAVGLYCFFKTKRLLKFPRLIINCLIIPVGIAILLNASWILPLFIFKTNLVLQNYSGVEGFRFFSFADFSTAFSLLHPNWPENIFGKVYFMKWEFLFFPILAFSSLLFLKNRHSGEERSDDSGINNGFWTSQNDVKKVSNMILFFALLGLIGVFLAKGSNEPFGELNVWIYEHLPGMSLFRDSTKFYLWIILSYSILIPFTISELANFLQKSFKKPLAYYLIPAIFIFFWLFSLRPAILGNLGGTFQNHTVSGEYAEVKNFLSGQPGFFRTLWVPKQLRFSFSLQMHPAIEATELFGTNNFDELALILKKPSSQNYLFQLGVKYVIIPYDSFGEYFLEDRKYSQEKRDEIEKKLDEITWLKKIISGKISVYETVNYSDHFILEKQGKISYQMISFSEYNLSISTAEDNRLFFIENFNPWWIARIGDKTIRSLKAQNQFNSFELPKGDYQIKIYYEPANFYTYGRIISLITLILALTFIIKFRKYEN